MHKNIYKIYKHPSGKVEVVKKGWSWPAFLFTWIWALSKKMWHVGFLVLFFLFFFIFMEFYNTIGISDLPEDWAIRYTKFVAFISYGFFIISTGIFFGINGNLWREKNLFSRGYKFRIDVEENNMEAAMAFFLEREKNETISYVENSDILDKKISSFKRFIYFMVTVTLISTFFFVAATSNERNWVRSFNENQKEINLLQQQMYLLLEELYSGSKTPDEKKHIEKQLSELESSLRKTKSLLELRKAAYKAFYVPTLQVK